MKIQSIYGALASAAILTLSPLAFAQTTVTTASSNGAVSTSTTTTAGTISEFGADTIVVRSDNSPEPIRYGFSKSTVYVDETGAPVSREVIHSGAPVTVHYIKEGDRMIANRVIVRRQKAVISDAPAAAVETRTVAPAVVEEKRTTTTTTSSNRKDKDKD